MKKYRGFKKFYANIWWMRFWLVMTVIATSVAIGLSIFEGLEGLIYGLILECVDAT